MRIGSLGCAESKYCVADKQLGKETGVGKRSSGTE